MEFSSIKFDFEISAVQNSGLPEIDRPEVVFCGRSNVGKSSLINKTMGRRGLARVSATPGKTATVNSYLSKPLRIIDLPGYGYAKKSKKEKSLFSSIITEYLFYREFDLAIVLVDLRHDAMEIDLAMISQLVEGEIPFIICFTKADKISPKRGEETINSFREKLPYFDDIVHIVTSSEKGWGIDKLQDVLVEIIGE